MVIPDMSNLPRLVLIADGFTQPEWGQRSLQAVRYGVKWVHLRDHGARPDQFELAAKLLSTKLRDVSPRLKVSINPHLEVADRLHLPFHASMRNAGLTKARGILGPDALIGCSTHSVHEVAKAAREGADYVFFGHVFPTRSHPGEEPRGLDELKTACLEAGKMPVIAIGGITADRVKSCLEVGAHGVAVISSLMTAPNLFEAVGRFAHVLHEL